MDKIGSWEIKERKAGRVWEAEVSDLACCTPS